MKKILFFTLFLGGSVLFCPAQTNPGHSNVVSTDGIKSKNSPVSGNDKPVVNSSTEKNINTGVPKSNADTPKSPTSVELSETRYLEYKVDPGNNSSSSDAPADEQKIILPIRAESYTDPNYELNKQKAEELTKQLEAPAVIKKTNEELILDLQAKIKAIKDGAITGSEAITKLPVYEKELQLLLNTKQTKSCVSE